MFWVAAISYHPLLIPYNQQQVTFMDGASIFVRPQVRYTRTRLSINIKLQG
jgi:hypothetical protein